MEHYLVLPQILIYFITLISHTKTFDDDTDEPKIITYYNSTNAKQIVSMANARNTQQVISEGDGLCLCFFVF